MVHICSDALWTMKSLLSSIVTCFKNITGPCYPGETGERGFRLTLSYSKSEKTHTTRHPPSPSTEEFLQSVPKTQCWHKIPLDNSRPSHTKGFGKTSIPRLRRFLAASGRVTSSRNLGIKLLPNPVSNNRINWMMAWLGKGLTNLRRSSPLFHHSCDKGIVSSRHAESTAPAFPCNWPRNTT